MYNNLFEIIARALIVRDNKILVCKNTTKEYYFLPGGHVENKETLAEALVREIEEEIGVTVTTYSFIGAVENIFAQGGEDVHELNFVFAVELDSYDFASQEAHIEIAWMSHEEFGNEKILPESLKNAVLKYFEDKKTFFIEAKKET